MAHNKDLRAESLESEMQWILLYPDLDVVLYIPGTKECFSMAKYKESIGKPYNRVNLLRCTGFKSGINETLICFRFV